MRRCGRPRRLILDFGSTLVFPSREEVSTHSSVTLTPVSPSPLLIRPSHHHSRAGFFEQAPIEKILVNHECNATSGIQVAHHFIKILVSQKKKGCVVFTSSIAASIPTPFAAMYASTKAFISQLAASLHIECQPLGIDVCAIHPSPVASNFYAQLDHKVDMIEAAAKGAVSPDSLMNDIFRSIGACAWRDLGGTGPVLLRA
jgi:NAD(P)-dependent dehydrogenase (short-subunit alcohol dehydrogenase family)